MCPRFLARVLRMPWTDIRNRKGRTGLQDRMVLFEPQIVCGFLGGNDSDFCFFSLAFPMLCKLYKY